MEILQRHGDTEIFSIYQKFIRYCLPDNPNIIFDSTKYNRYEKEKCFIEFGADEGKIKYLLNPKTRLFEEQKRKNNDTLTAPSSLEGNER